VSTIVAITGAKATGKSTLLHALSNFPDLATHFDAGITTVQSPGRRAAQLGLPLGGAGTDDTHLFFAKEHLANLRRGKAAGKRELILLDRCFIDHCAYVNRLSDSRALKDLMDEVLQHYLQGIDHVLVTALVPPFVEKETPTEPLHFRQWIEQEIWRLIGISGVASTRLNDPSQNAADAASAIMRVGQADAESR
jgi:predicted ATPase